MTNREWLNSLSDEKLARLISRKTNCDYCNFLKKNDKCTDSESCVKGIIEWLNSETESEEERDMQKSKLLRCPFCGGNVMLRIPDHFEDVHGNCVETYKLPQIECNCGIYFALQDISWQNLDEFISETIKAWNRRADNGY